MADGTVDVVICTRRNEKLVFICEGHNRLVTSATSISRVLAAAEFSMIDLNVLSRAPGHRKPVSTTVADFDAERIAAILCKEAYSSGQCYLICPCIADIDTVTAMLDALASI